MLRMRSDLGKAINQLRRDNRSGATELTAKAISVLIRFLKTADSRHPNAILDSFLDLGQQLFNAQPSIAPILNLINKIRVNEAGSTNTIRIKKQIYKQLRETLKKQKSSGARIARNSLSLIRNGYTIVTFSKSDAVLKSLTHAKRKGILFSVICSESRPQREGISTAQSLATAGIETLLVVDAALANFVPKADVVFVGADSIIGDEVINKVGTFGLAVAAREYSIPFYCLCAENKFLTRDGLKLLRIVQKDPREILRKKIKRLKVSNYYFDSTPLKYFSGVITEKGRFKVRQVRKMLLGNPKLPDDPFL